MKEGVSRGQTGEESLAHLPRIITSAIQFLALEAFSDGITDEDHRAHGLGARLGRAIIFHCVTRSRGVHLCNSIYDRSPAQRLAKPPSAGGLLFFVAKLPSEQYDCGVSGFPTQRPSACQLFSSGSSTGGFCCVQGNFSCQCFRSLLRNP